MGCIASRNTIKIHLKPGSANREIGVPGSFQCMTPLAACSLCRAQEERTIRENETHPNRRLLFVKDNAMKKDVACSCHHGVSRRTVLQGGLAAAAASSMGGVRDELLAE